jgi:hypothetical protein
MEPVVEDRLANAVPDRQEEAILSIITSLTSSSWGHSA